MYWELISMGKRGNFSSVDLELGCPTVRQADLIFLAGWKKSLIKVEKKKQNEKLMLQIIFLNLANTK